MKLGTQPTRTELTAVAFSPKSVVLINGISGAGKTVLARAIAPMLGIPLFSKDDFKESFDDFGPAGIAGPLLGALAMEALWTAAAAVPKAVIESYWHAERDRSFVATGLARASLRPVVEVFCEVPAELARQRAIARQRHRVHGRVEEDAQSWAEVVRGAVPLGIAPVLRVDTSGTVDLPVLAGNILKFLASDSASC